MSGMPRPVLWIVAATLAALALVGLYTGFSQTVADPLGAPPPVAAAAGPDAGVVIRDAEAFVPEKAPPRPALQTPVEEVEAEPAPASDAPPETPPAPAPAPVPTPVPAAPAPAAPPPPPAPPAGPAPIAPSELPPI